LDRPAYSAPVTSIEELAGWAGRDHRQVHADLVTAGWRVCGVGDWAVTLRSPDGLHAARVCPFDPAYPVFVALCGRLPDHPYLPRIDVDVSLEGGAQLTVMEFLTPVPTEAAEAVRKTWDGGGDPLVSQVRAEAEALNAAAGRRVPWWDQIDLNHGNIMVSLSGQLKLVDVFCLDGAAMYATLLERPDELAERIPSALRRYMTDIAFISRTASPAEIDALRKAAAVAG
jgi:hypothetical protein